MLTLLERLSYLDELRKSAISESSRVNLFRQSASPSSISASDATKSWLQIPNDRESIESQIAALEMESQMSQVQ
jgi:hypothetical protein